MILFGLVVGLGLTSCDKDAIQQNDPVGGNESSAIVAKITGFHEAVTGNLKIDRPLSVDSVVWYTEADINYYYCDANHEHLYSKTYFCELNIDVDDNNMVIARDYNDLYQAMIDSLQDFWDTVVTDDTTKYMVIVDVESKGIENQEATFVLRSYIGYGSGSFQVPIFGDTDYWAYTGGANNSGGKCGTYSGYEYLDAGILITQHINWSYPAIAHTITIQTEWAEINGGETICTGTGNPLDNICDYRLFWNAYRSNPQNQLYGTFHTCLSPEEMNCHTSGTRAEMLDNMPQGTGWHFMSMEIGESYMSFPSGDYNLGHKADFYYRKYILGVCSSFIGFN
ncbi:MAG: hypothetical protein K9H64_11900 [Bacteroidales bacterium]|nr:hypothetical protein [Bacteroidales bacterium]MCF8456745.1 hypothetical protein [Bacteroidales bacterium]